MAFLQVHYELHKKLEANKEITFNWYVISGNAILLWSKPFKKLGKYIADQAELKIASHVVVDLDS